MLGLRSFAIEARIRVDQSARQCIGRRVGYRRCTRARRWLPRYPGAAKATAEQVFGNQAPFEGPCFALGKASQNFHVRMRRPHLHVVLGDRLPGEMVACAAVFRLLSRARLVTELQESPPTTRDTAALYHLVQERGRHILWRYRVPQQDHEDILQQAFLAFLRKKESIACPEAWLLGVVRNSCRLYWRTQRERQETSVDAGLLDLLVHDPAQDLEVLRGQLRRAIDTLAPKCRAFLILRYRLGLSPAEVAHELGCTREAAEKAGSRCVAALARRLLRISGRPAPRS